MIEWRWNLRPLTVRDRTANNLAEALDFTQFSLFAPQFSVPSGPFGTICSESDQWLALKALARSFGWPE